MTIKSPGAGTPGRKGGKEMRYSHGTWFYQGQAYRSLRAALSAAWPK